MDPSSVTPLRRSAAFAAVLLVVAFPVAVGAQPMTRCASCHFVNMSTVPAPEHLGEWQRSAHAKQGVGCDQCHGGDPWTYEPLAAHRGVLGPVNPNSPVNADNLVRTCSPCHRPITLAFSTTLHGTLAAAGVDRAPTCTSCHGVMSAQVPSPRALESRCAACHPSGSMQADYAGLMRTGVESLNVQRLRADSLAGAIERIDDRSLRAELTVALHDARGLLKSAVASAHSFDVQRVNERVDDASRRLAAIETRIPR